MAEPVERTDHASPRAAIEPTPGFADDVRAGLGGTGQKVLPPKYFYDELGSALFEAICRLPEYGLSRAGERLLERHARALAPHLPGPLRVVELGCGAGRKLRLLLEGLRSVEIASCTAIDVSPAALEGARAEVATVPGLPFEPVLAPFDDGLRAVASRRRTGERLLVLFLGSNLGNYDGPAADAFLAGVRARLVPGDVLLLGLDLVQEESQLLRAYDDPLGVTAAFDLNLLARMNRELGAAFDLARFRHAARWTPAERRVEMHILSRGSQTVAIPAAGMTAVFADGESIWTESSHKYVLAELPNLGSRAGFRPVELWVDDAWPFVHALFEAV